MSLKRAKPEDSPLTAAAQTQAADQDIEDCPCIVGALGTEVGRRILWKAVASGEKNVYTVPASMATKVFTKNENDNGFSIGIFFFREFTRNCPIDLGRYDPVQDVFYINLPDEPTAGWHAGLLAFANTNERQLRCALRAKAAGKRGGQCGSGASSSGRQRPNDSLDSQLSAVMGEASPGSQLVSGAASSDRQRPNESLDSQLVAVMGDESQGE
jgi:hypothetical protein